jgi:hypothetical protein
MVVLENNVVFLSSRNDFKNAALHAGALCKKTWIFGVVAGGKYRYCAKALELLARAETECDPQMRAELENLAAAFVRLAEQAERNSQFDLTYEPPPPKTDDPNLKP